MQKQGKKLVILGAGESGVGAALLGVKNKYQVFVSDKGIIANKYKEVLEHNNISWEEKKHTEAIILEANVVVKSPGIPDHIELIRKIKAKGIKVISEIEFAFPFTKGELIGITGSNGKTTTTLWLGYILQTELKKNKVVIAGNIGDSFAKQVAVNDKEKYVLELSSFQLDGIEKFKSHIAIVTNISPDHLDRYEYKYANYIDAKMRVTMNQTKNDYLIYDAEDNAIVKWLSENKTKAIKVPFTLKDQSFLVKQYGQIPEIVAYVQNNEIIIKENQNEIKMNIENLALMGKHNVKNAMASAMTAKLLQVRKNTIRKCLEDFEGVEHRLEKVLKINGVQYINDSKATNVNASYYALESVTTQTVWIVGGVDKGNDYDALLPLVNEKVKAIICLGVDNEKIKSAFSNVIDLIVETQGAEEAVKVAYKIAEKGETVLLSPACASFDLFNSYEDRGRQFKAAIRNL